MADPLADPPLGNKIETKLIADVGGGVRRGREGERDGQETRRAGRREEGGERGALRGVRVLCMSWSLLGRIRVCESFWCALLFVPLIAYCGVGLWIQRRSDLRRAAERSVVQPGSLADIFGRMDEVIEITI